MSVMLARVNGTRGCVARVELARVSVAFSAVSLGWEGGAWRVQLAWWIGWGGTCLSAPSVNRCCGSTVWACGGTRLEGAALSRACI